MQAASNGPPNASLRNQLLSSDIGSIDVRYETPVNVAQHPQQQQRFNSLQSNQNNYQNYQQNYPPPQNYNNNYQQPHFAQPSSRGSSLTSNNSSFNIFKKAKGKLMNANSGFNDDDDEDEEDDGKDMVLDNGKTNDVSFHELKSIKDRGRYGGGASFDSTPIIPTLSSINSNGQMTNTQYRKQKTAFKKQQFNQAGKILNDPRAMSLQNGRNPYLDDPRNNSLQQQQQPFLNGPPRTYSLTNQPQQFAPRNNSFQNPQPPQFPPNSRNNSLTNQQQFTPRNNSLTNQPQQFAPRNNSYPNQQPPFAPRNNSFQSQQHPPFAPRTNSLTNQPQNFQSQNPRAYSLNTNGNPYVQNQRFPPQQRAYGPPPSNRNQNGRNLPPPTQNRNSIPGVPSPLSQSQTNLSTIPDSRNEIPQIQLQPVVQEKSYEDEKDLNHHYLADNRETDESTSNSRGSSSIGIPNEESTPLPSPEAKQLSATTSNSDQISPSKIPRSKGLPHLSLLSLGDDSDDSDDEINKEISPSSPEKPNPFDQQQHQSTEFIPRVLEPLDESKPYEARSSTPPNVQENNFISPKRKNLVSPMKNRNSKNQISISSEHSAVSSNHGYINDYNKKLYGLVDNETNNEGFVTASQFTILGSKAEFNKNSGFQQQESGTSNKKLSDPIIVKSQQEQQLNRSPQKIQSSGVEENISTTNFNEAPRDRLGDDIDEDLDKTPIVKQSNSFSVHTTPLHIRKESTESGQGYSSKSPFSKNFKSPKFFKNWTKKKDDRKKSKESFEPVTKSADSIKPIESFQSRNNVRPKDAFPARNLSNFPEDLKPEPIRHDDDYNTTNGTVIRHTLDPSANNSFVNESKDLPIVPNNDDNNSGNKLGESFVPVPEKNLHTEEVKKRSLSFTVAQLGIMEDKTDLIRELELVSRELAASIKREIRLEERLKLSPKTVNSLSPTSIENSSDERIRDNALKIAELTKKLNEERKIRYIAEEHVLLHESNQEPSPLKLNYEIDQLKSELAYRDELINKLQSQVEDFKHEIPILKKNLDKISEINENNEFTIIPNLKDEIEVLSIDRKKLSILNEKFKILKNQKLELEKKLNLSNDDLSNYNPNNGVTDPIKRSSQIHKPFMTGNSNSFDATETKHKRLTSLSLLNVSSADI